MTIPLCREVGCGRGNGGHVRRQDRWNRKMCGRSNVWIKGQNCGCSARPAPRVTSLHCGGTVSSLPVKLNFFFSLGKSGEKGNPFFPIGTVRWCRENAERANQRSGDLKKSAVAGSTRSGNRCISGGGAASTRREERTSADIVIF